MPSLDCDALLPRASTTRLESERARAVPPPYDTAPAPPSARGDRGRLRAGGAPRIGARPRSQITATVERARGAPGPGAYAGIATAARVPGGRISPARPPSFLDAEASRDDVAHEDCLPSQLGSNGRDSTPRPVEMTWRIMIAFHHN